MGWVFRHSPYKGAAFVVHLAIADSVNDQNDNEFWMSQARLCEKARTSHATTERAVKALRDDGLLTLLEDNSTAGKPCRYRFEMPPRVPHGEGGGPSQGVTRVPHGEGQTQRTTQENPITRASREFEAFWAMYPRKVGKPAALKAFRSRASDALMQGTVRWAEFWARSKTEIRFIPHPSTFLNQERYLDTPPVQEEISPWGPGRGQRTAGGDWVPVDV